MTPEDVCAEIRSARQAHEAWKMRLLAALDGRGEAIDPLHAARDELCDFGRFLHRKDLDSWIVTGKPHEVITRLHREFHAQAAEVTRLTRAGNAAAARTMLDGSYRDASKKLFLALHKWEKELSDISGQDRALRA